MNSFKSLCVLLIFLCSVVVVLPGIWVAKAEDTIYIRADGTVEGTDKIRSDGDLYTFIDDINGSLVVERDDVVVDGEGYVLDFGRGKEVEGVTVEGKNNVTLKNILIVGSGSAINFSGVSDCVVVNNTILVNETGLWLKNSEGNNILQNSIEAVWGISLDDSSGNVISANNISETVLWGIRFTNSSNNIFTQNHVATDETAAPAATVIEIDHSSGNTIERNNVTGTREITEFSEIKGIQIRFADNNLVSDNTITGNDLGLYIQRCSGSQIFSNKISDNGFGIGLADSPNNTFRYNLLENNENHFRVSGDYLSLLINDIDVSNTADGKPIYYLVNKRDVTIPSDAGYVALVNCTGVTVQNLDLSRNGQGVMLAFTENSTIRNNNLSNNKDGVWIVSSSNNVITGNNISTTEFGIAFVHYGNEIESKNNVVANNTITHNGRGIWLERNNNSFVGNHITNNVHGVWINGGSDNVFYHNNFVNNTNQIYDLAQTTFYGELSQNIWDNGTAGNYWSDYNGTDTDRDGIGDTPYIINENNTDHYPLISQFKDTTPPTINILSPENTTYPDTEIQLNFTVSEQTSWMAYRLDSGGNVTITGNTPLTELSAGSHRLTVYANDTAGNMAASEPIYFTIAQREEESFPLGWVLVALVITIIPLVVWWGYRRTVKEEMA